MNHEDIIASLSFIKPNSEYQVIGEDLIWLDKTQTKPTEKEIQDGFIAWQNKQKNDEQKEIEAKKIAEAKLIKLGLTYEDLKALGF